jgi:hypothetical protein
VHRVGGPTKEIEPMLVDAAQIATAYGHAVTVEELENLDRDLAAVVEAVAQLGGGKLSVGCRDGQFR